MSWLGEAAPQSERERVASALAGCAVLSLPAGSVLGPDRVGVDSLLLVEAGIALVSVAGSGPRRIIVALAGPGSVLLAPPRDQWLEALDDVRMTLVSPSARRQLLEIPGAAGLLLDGIANGLRECQESLGNFANVRHADRLRDKLSQLARMHGSNGTAGVAVHLPLTHELLADMVGSTRETVTRSLSQLGREGVVRHERGTLQLAAAPDRPDP